MNFINVESSDINAVAVSGDNLVIRFNKGGIYEYIGAAKELDNLLKADSKGKYFHKFIRDNYLCNKLS